ncbi:MAG: PAS domain S-box protein [Nitrospirae bacterium]|nr:PAS domain S-box protein [Nitrospirota bacterium]
MFGNLIKKIKAGNLWHLVWLSVIASEILTASIVSVASIIFRGKITHDSLITGAVTACIVAAVVTAVIIYLIKQWRKSEEEFMAAQEQLSRKAEIENYTKNLEHVVTLRTERLNNALKNLRQQKDFMDRLISTVGALIVVLDHEGKIVMFNKTCEDVTGFKEDEVKLKHVWDLFVPERFIPTVRMAFDELLVQKIPNTFKNPWLTKDGREKTILWNNTVIVGEKDRISYAIATGIDITEKEMMEEHLMEAQRLQSIATLVTGLSHNFNNILVGILGYAGLLRIKISTPDRQDTDEMLKYIDVIENSVKNASDFIKHLMMFSKKMEYVKKDISLDEIVGDALEIIESSFPKNILIEAELHCEPCKIKADKDRLQQAVLNICINSKDAMPEGGRLKIEAFSRGLIQPEYALQKFGMYAVIRISDTGQGVDEDAKRKIFEPFFTTKGLLHHTGLGLSIAYSIIKEHNGYITVDNNSEAEKGTTFTIYLPVV